MWFIETPWPPIFCCLAGIAILYAAWRSNARKAWGMGMVGLAAACVVIFFVERWIVTEKERVEQGVIDVVRAFERKNFEKCFEFFYQSVRAKAKSLILSEAEYYEIPDPLRITDIIVEMKGEAAIAKFRVNGSVRELSGGRVVEIPHMTSRWKAEWKKVQGDWKITRIVAIDPIGSKESEYYSIP